ncbi:MULTISPECIES: hypothetical protein [unclassified Variovorax]
MTPRLRRHITNAGCLAAALVVLGGVFAMYVHPDFLVTLADQIWSCF